MVDRTRQAGEDLANQGTSLTPGADATRHGSQWPPGGPRGPRAEPSAVLQGAVLGTGGRTGQNGSRKPTSFWKFTPRSQRPGAGEERRWKEETGRRSLSPKRLPQEQRAGEDHGVETQSKSRSAQDQYPSPLLTAREEEGRPTRASGREEAMSVGAGGDDLAGEQQGD